jgi:hypothetical protein
VSYRSRWQHLRLPVIQPSTRTQPHARQPLPDQMQRRQCALCCGGSATPKPHAGVCVSQCHLQPRQLHMGPRLRNRRQIKLYALRGVGLQIRRRQFGLIGQAFNRQRLCAGAAGLPVGVRQHGLQEVGVAPGFQ